MHVALLRGAQPGLGSLVAAASAQLAVCEQGGCLACGLRSPKWPSSQLPDSRPCQGPSLRNKCSL